MIVFHKTKIQISPCIVSKAIFALELKALKPKNCKRCSIYYWKRTIDTLCLLNKIDNKILIKTAITRYDALMKCNKK